MSVSTYLDIMYPRLLLAIFWVQNLQRTPASMYIRRCLPSSQLTSVNNLLAVGVPFNT